MNSDTTNASLDAFKGEVFMYEVIISVIVFTAVYIFLKSFSKKEKEAKKKNSKYVG
jgi:5-bromo-4-chloroindolyl phosphate hydrolysis protein